MKRVLVEQFRVFNKDTNRYLTDFFLVSPTGLLFFWDVNTGHTSLVDGPQYQVERQTKFFDNKRTQIWEGDKLKATNGKTWLVISTDKVSDGTQERYLDDLLVKEVVKVVGNSETGKERRYRRLPWA